MIFNFLCYCLTATWLFAAFGYSLAPSFVASFCSFRGFSFAFLSPFWSVWSLSGLDRVPVFTGMTSSMVESRSLPLPLRFLAPYDDVPVASAPPPAFFSVSSEYLLPSAMNDCTSGIERVPRRSALREAFGLSTVYLNQPTSWPQMYWLSYSLHPRYLSYPWLYLPMLELF